MKKKCKCVLGVGNIAIKINNALERNGFIYLWDKLGNEYLDKNSNRDILKFPVWFVVVPAPFYNYFPEEPFYVSYYKEGQKDLLLMPSDDAYCEYHSISLMEASFLFSIGHEKTI